MGPTKIREGTMVFDNFEIGKELNSGGYGKVYECKNDPDYVIKVETVHRSPE